MKINSGLSDTGPFWRMTRVLTHPITGIATSWDKLSKVVGIRYGQRVPGGWTTHDLRHTCLTNLAMAGVRINGIKEYAGHASIVETRKYLKFMPQSIDLAASVSTRLAALANVDNGSNNGHKKKGPGQDRLAYRAQTLCLSC